MAARLFDYDLKAHLEQLEARHIAGNDFRPFPLQNASVDFVGDLMQNYLQDIKYR